LDPRPSLSHSNTKLGNLLHSWSMTAGTVSRGGTCPGESAICSELCYASRGFFRMPSVEATHRRNRLFSLTDDFVPWMLSKMIVDNVRVLRIHVAGDFYNAEYVDKWHKIVQRARRVIFFAYTRSWREEEIFPALARLAGEPNMHMWFSMDRQTGPAPLLAGVRRCYLAIDDIDAATVPHDCDLVFRDRPKAVMKSTNGVLVCPTENGVAGRLHHTCSTCGVCWRKQTLPRWEQLLLPLLTRPDNSVPLNTDREVRHAGLNT